ncbi:unnamed protein product [Caenorhabditis sp. 36 PRJEB53466]|nr:unnamed protein product [Caenorhabditis sp. 36 PRJEB53466]
MRFSFIFSLISVLMDSVCLPCTVIFLSVDIFRSPKNLVSDVLAFSRTILYSVSVIVTISTAVNLKFPALLSETDWFTTMLANSDSFKNFGLVYYLLKTSFGFNYFSAAFQCLSTVQFKYHQLKVNNINIRVAGLRDIFALLSITGFSFLVTIPVILNDLEIIHLSDGTYVFKSLSEIIIRLSITCEFFEPAFLYAYAFLPVTSSWMCHSVTLAHIITNKKKRDQVIKIVKGKLGIKTGLVAPLDPQAHSPNRVFTITQSVSPMNTAINIHRRTLTVVE